MAFDLAWITGASSGIGESLAKRLAAEGISLMLSGRNNARLEEVALALRVPVTLLPGDLAKPGDRRSLIKCALEREPDLVINCAGFGLYGPAWQHEVAEVMGMVEVNIAALAEITLELTKAWVERGRRGVVMNISSAAALFPFPGFATYAASKSFVNSFSLGLDMELKERGVRVLVACPGHVRTGFQARAAGTGLPRKRRFGMEASFAAEEVWAQIRRREPLRIFNWPYRIGARLANFLPDSWVRKLLAARIKGRYQR